MQQVTEKKLIWRCVGKERRRPLAQFGPLGPSLPAFTAGTAKPEVLAEHRMTKSFRSSHQMWAALFSKQLVRVGDGHGVHRHPGKNRELSSRLAALTTITYSM